MNAPAYQTRHLSIKLKLTLWFTLFMTLIAGICLGLMLLLGDRISSGQSEQLLSLSVRSRIPDVSLVDGTLTLAPDFQFYENNVYFMIYNKEHALLSGQTPPGFPVGTELENGITRLIHGDQSSYYVLDFRIPSGWENEIWLRGVLEQNSDNQFLNSSVTLFLILLPFFILSAAAGGYLLARRALMPIQTIAETAEAINEGKDLSQRIGLPENTDEVSRLAASFDRMIARLEQSFEAEQQFTSDASHELRTPTAVILAQCSFAEKHAETIDDYREALEVIQRQADKMSLLISRLLELTRLDLGTQNLHMEAQDFSQMVQILCEEQDSHERGISLYTEIDDNITVNGDAFLLSRAITNLLDNARKYGRENGWIKVRLHTSQTDAILEIEDNGIGIAAEQLDKIWQRFYQVNPSRATGSGLGLGLSMVHQILQLHHGSIQVQSTPDSGSRFILKFPLSSAS